MSALQYPMRGPTALGGDRRRFLSLAFMLAFTDFKLRFYGSVLGYLWTLMRPLLLFGVLYAVFSEVVRIGEGVEHYPVMLLSGIVLFTYFSEVTTSSVSSLVDRENLLRKIHFPRMVVPLSVALTASFNLMLNLVVVFFFLLISGVELHWSWVQLPLILAFFFALVVGAGMLLSALYVPFRDVRPVWDVVAQALFYATPVLYPIELLAARSETLANIAMLNPLAVIVQQFRHAVIDPSAPSAAEAAGGGALLVIPVAIVLLLFAGGLLVFNRMAPRIAERL